MSHEVRSNWGHSKFHSTQPVFHDTEKRANSTRAVCAPACAGPMAGPRPHSSRSVRRRLRWSHGPILRRAKQRTARSSLLLGPVKKCKTLWIVFLTAT